MSLRGTQLLALLLLGLCAGPAGAERVVVLVTSQSCAMTSISMLDVRKAYLGVTIRFGGRNIRAFRLNNDRQLNQVFFQSVVAMSERTYERRLVSLALKYGAPRPKEYSSVESLVNAITRSECGIGYMWSDDADNATGIKSIRVLWQGE